MQRERQSIFGIFQSPLSTHSFIERFVSDLEMAISKPEKEVVAQARGAPGVAPQWIPPVQGSLNVNADAALSKNSNVAAMTAVARDKAGVFMGASALVLKGISDPGDGGGAGVQGGFGPCN